MLITNAGSFVIASLLVCFIMAMLRVELRMGNTVSQSIHVHTSLESLNLTYKIGKFPDLMSRRGISLTRLVQFSSVMA